MLRQKGDFFLMRMQPIQVGAWEGWGAGVGYGVRGIRIAPSFRLYNACSLLLSIKRGEIEMFG